MYLPGRLIVLLNCPPLAIIDYGRNGDGSRPGNRGQCRPTAAHQLFELVLGDESALTQVAPALVSLECAELGAREGEQTDAENGEGEGDLDQAEAALLDASAPHPGRLRSVGQLRHWPDPGFQVWIRTPPRGVRTIPKSR